LPCEELDWRSLPEPDRRQRLASLPPPHPREGVPARRPPPDAAGADPSGRRRAFLCLEPPPSAAGRLVPVAGAARGPGLLRRLPPGARPPPGAPSPLPRLHRLAARARRGRRRGLLAADA